MRVRLLVGLSGPAYSVGPGDQRDFPQDEAIRLIQAGYAAPVSDHPVETASKLPAPETRHPLDHDGDGRPGGSLKPEQTDDLTYLRGLYHELFGKRPFMGWAASTLREKIDAKRVE